MKLLLQTAALPEFFGTVWGGSVDGGVADNTPIIPVADFAPNVLIVIYLPIRLMQAALD
jgi:predicted acylesterase/phospholipase RssA